MNQHFQVLGSGSYAPGVGISAAEFELRCRCQPGWIEQHTGVMNRFECVAPESLATMARQAIVSAMADANMTWKQIDVIIDCSTSRYQPIPCNAARIQSLFGEEANAIPSFDVHGTCLGFLLGLNVINSLFATGTYETALLVAAESTLSAADFNTPAVATLLSDGAAALVLQCKRPTTTYHFSQETFSEHYDDCQIRGGGHDLTVFDYSSESDSNYRFQMNGPQLVRTVLTRLPRMVDQLVLAAGGDRSELFVIPHQASPKALELVRRKLRFKRSQYINLARDIGNMASASIPFLLDQLRKSGQLHDQQRLLLLGTSAGYSQAGMIFEL